MLDARQRRGSRSTYTADQPVRRRCAGRAHHRDGTDTVAPSSPVTILHHNDSHGNLAKGAYVGYTQLATPDQAGAARTTRPHPAAQSGGDNIQGDAMMYYFKTAPTGYRRRRYPLPADAADPPHMAVMNAMDYDGWTLGNHEFNFGSDGLRQPF